MGHRMRSPLDGREIIETLGLEPGPDIGAIKEFLESQLIDKLCFPATKQAQLPYCCANMEGV